jgi:lipoprotein NlpD
VVSTYSGRDETRKGIKIGVRNGQEIQAAESGKVVYAGSGLIGYGRLIIVKHNEKYLSAYGHNSKLLVKEGRQVRKGDKIAEMGLSKTGKPLLHFEIRRDGKPINPQILLPKR